MTIYLGIDYGEKHLGLALADGPLATPLISLEMGVSALPSIARLVSAHQVTQIVLGLPEGQADPKVRAFGDQLHTLTGLPVLYHPETLSTQEAISKLRESGAGKSKLMNDHVYAACLILEDYLETHHEVGYTET